MHATAQDTALRQHLERRLYHLGLEEASRALGAGMAAREFFFTFSAALIEQAAVAAAAGLVEATKQDGRVNRVRALKESLKPRSLKRTSGERHFPRA